MTTREVHWKVAGKDQSVRIEESKGRGTFHISDRSIHFQRLDHNCIEVDGKIHRFHVVRDRTSCTVWLDGHTYHLERIEKGLVTQPAASAASGNIAALMPGKLLRMEVAVGDTVAEKQTVAIMESMKMESSLHAPRAGRIVEIRCQPGQIVEMGEVLMVVD